MSIYKFSLHDYHAIKNAVICIDGITVLSGENGCGKSTLSKWLYYMVNGAGNFDIYIYKSFISTIQNKLNHLNVVAHDITRSKDNDIEALILEGKRKLKRLSNDTNQDNIDNTIQIYEAILDDFVQALSDYFKHSPSPVAVDRILRFLNIGINENEDTDTALNKYFISQRTQLNEHVDQYLNDKIERKESQFFTLLRSNYRITDKKPANIQLEEDGVKLLRRDKVGTLYNLSRAIYIDTPMAILDEPIFDKEYWNTLVDLMMNPSKDIHLSNEERKLMFQITRLIKGKVEVNKDIPHYPELHYLREDDGLDIKLTDVATGYKSFAYLLRLLANGYLNSSTLLLIDEPEAHLHPQFIVEFARLLVLLNKRLGVKIMIASHNPDMVAAIKSIAQKEDVMDTTRFYIAECSDKAYTYTYRNLGNDIEDIFKSFNIAYERIDQYGSSCF